MGKIDYSLLNYTGKVRYIRAVLRGLLNNIDDLEEYDLDCIADGIGPTIDELECNDFFGTEGISID